MERNKLLSFYEWGQGAAFSSYLSIFPFLYQPPKIKTGEEQQVGTGCGYGVILKT